MLRLRRKLFAIAACICLIMNNPSVAYATVNNAICISNDYFTGDTTFGNQLKTYFTNMSYNATVYFRPVTVNGVNTLLGSQRTFYISTHGTSSGGHLILSASVQYTYSSVPSSVGSSFAFLSACYSAKTCLNQNLCSKLVSNGADAVVGYGQEVDVDSSRDFEKIFYNNFIGNSNKASVALSKAKLYVKSLYGDSDHAYTSSALFGNGNLYYSNY